MSPGAISPLSSVKALTFDVFGTVVDWRSSVTEELLLRAYRKQAADLPAPLREVVDGLKEEDWARFAQEWRDAYKGFCRSFDPQRDEWKSIDQHHRESLVELLDRWRLTGLYTETEVDSLSLVWHRLSPWPDSSDGLRALGDAGLTTATLSNGNVALLRDLDDFGGLGFRRILSAEMFGAYKPHPSVYAGAVRELGGSVVRGGQEGTLRADEVAMVAAHLGDLKAARVTGMRTVYVERAREEDWREGEERYEEARGWVDLWISEGEGGFVALARKMSELA